VEEMEEELSAEEVKEMKENAGCSSIDIAQTKWSIQNFRKSVKLRR